MKSILTLALCALLAATTAAAEGSWGQINQPVGRPKDWQRFVTDSPFALGETNAIGEIGKKTKETGETNEAGEAGEARVQSYGSYPCLDGSTVAVPLGMELARQLLGMEEGDLAGFVAFSTTHSAYDRLIHGKPSLGVKILSQHTTLDETQPVNVILATEPSAQELQMAAEAGVTLVKTPICYDAFVFLVNAKNPVKSLTLDQIRQIYVGQVQNWQSLGGKDAVILPFQREPNSGSQTAMENLVMQGVPLTGAVANFVSDGMADLVRQIGDFDQGEKSIGYSYLYYVENLYKSGQVRALEIGGVAPTHDNIRSGQYPLTTNYYAVYRKGDPLGEAFTEWLLSPAGQKSIAQAGYIAME